MKHSLLSPSTSKALLGAAMITASFSIAAGPAKAVDAAFPPTPLSQIIAGCTAPGLCTLGDKTVWGVSYNPFGSSLLASQIDVGAIQTDLNYSINADFTTATNPFGIKTSNTATGLEIGYNISILPGNPFVFEGVQLASQGTGNAGTTSTAEVKKFVYDVQGGTLLTTLTSTNFAPAPGGVLFDDAIKGYKALYIIDRYKVTGSSASIFAASNSYIQSPTSSEVPGPLPLLGAAAAFGYSRKLRKRLAVNNSIA